MHSPSCASIPTCAFVYPNVKKDVLTSISRQQQRNDAFRRFTPASGASYATLNTLAFYPRKHVSRNSSISSRSSVDSERSSNSATSARSAATSFASARSSLTSPFDLRQRKAYEGGKAPVAFKQLPEAVLECISIQLRSLHEASGRGYEAGLMRDLLGLAVTCKQWSPVALASL